MTMSMGRLDAVAALDRPDLLAPSVAKALANDDGTLPAAEVGVAEIDPDLADTAAFCEQYGVSLDVSANCVVVTGKRDGEARFAACVILATTRADVNGAARRALDVRKASFAPVDMAVAETGMEYGGITPVGLPADWPVYVDAAVAAADRVVIGSGVRRSKLTVPGALLIRLPGAAVIEGLGR
jgi:prolyl-tRNA editing enzyme YbaK/EbsC (Cys-tRNA(Pro) deacylase)